MAHLIHQAPDGRIVKTALPNTGLPPVDVAATLFDLGRLPITIDQPHIVIGADHPAARLPASRLSVDFATQQITILPEPVVYPTRVEYANAVDDHINSVAIARGYSSTLSMISYDTSSVPQYAAEAAAMRAWRDNVWLGVAAIEAEVLAGQRQQPTIAELIAALPPHPFT